MRIEETNFPPPVLEILKKELEILNPPQAAALNAGLLERKNIVVASPTASGKTMIAELAILKNFLSSRGKAVYIVPLKALASEKYSEFSEKYRKIGMKIAISIGDLDSNDTWLENHDLIIASNEKMDSLLRHEAKWVSSVSLVVCDEVHMLNDVSRGPTLEIVLTRMRDMCDAQFLALSATIKNAEEIAEWLGANLVKSDYRPVKLYYGVAYPDEEKTILEYEGKGDFVLSESEPETALSRDVVARGKQALFFVSTRRSAEAAAERIAEAVYKHLGDEDKAKLKKISDEALHALPGPTKQCRRLAAALAKGAAFHHAGLVAKQRAIIEDNFRRGIIKILAATPTLAFGINLPAWRVYIRDVKRYTGYGSDYLPVLEVQQMCVPGDAKIMMSDGIYENAADVVERFNTPVMSVNENFEVEKDKIKEKYSRYANELLKIKTSSGRELTATQEHPILTLINDKADWVSLGKIHIGSRVAILNKLSSVDKKVLFIDLFDENIYVKNAKTIIRKILKNGKIKYKKAAKLLNIPFKTMKAYGYNKSVPLKYIKTLVEIADITKDDLVELLQDCQFKTKYGSSFKPGKYIDSEFGWFLGIIASEGSIVNYTGHGKWKGVKYSKLKITNTDESIIRKIENICVKLGISSYKRSHRGGFSGSRVSYTIEISNQALITILRKFIVYSGQKSHTLRAASLSSMSDEVVAGYLAGVFDGDGNVSKAPSIRLGSKSKFFLEDCKLLLLRFGIRTTIIEENGFYTLQVSGKERINRFFVLIPCVRLKGKKLKYNKNTRPEIKMGDVYFEKVASVEHIRLEKPIKVFNISVLKNENYICNDFIVHNCGRAGRPKYDKEGEAILVAKNENEKNELKERYVYGEPEPIYSKLSVEPVLRMHVLALVASKAAKSKYEMQEFFAKTFFSHQYKDIDEVMKRVEKVLAELESYDFVKMEKEPFMLPDFVPAFAIDKDYKISATPLGRRVSELYVDPASAFHIISSLKPLTDFEYISVINRCMEMQPMMRVKKNEYEDLEKEIERFGITTPDVWDVDYEEFAALFKTSLMFNEWMNEASEDQMMEKFGIAPGELHVKMNNAEWLLYAGRELALVLGRRGIASRFNRLRLRIKHGVKEELLRLVKLKGIGRVRARILFKNAIKSPSDIKNNFEKVEQLLGAGVARQIAGEVK